ncbi:MAG: hypothetical protein Q7L55_08365 [Actinomycetota bacterium]|nr:hypothetical protein [Actinomycetota bacterium]
MHGRLLATALSAVGLLALALAPALTTAEGTSFRGFNYPTADCTPMQGTTQLGLAPQQWSSAVGLPLTPSGTPAAQRIVIGEIDQTANATAVNNLMTQCGLPNVALPVVNSTLYPPASTPGLEATLDASVVAAALPANASITMINTGAGSEPFYSMLVSAANACGFVFAGDPNVTLSNISKGSGFPDGGCIISISYGGAEVRAQETDADFMLQQLADQGVIVVVSGGDEGSGGCISNTGLNFGNGAKVAVSGIALTSGVLTVLTGSAHGFSVGDHAYVTLQAPGLLSMTNTVTVTSTPTPNTFTFNFAGNDFAPTAASGAASVGFGTLTPQYPASNPNVLAVGGTQWQTPADGQAHGVEIAFAPSLTHTDYVWHDSNPNTNCANVPTFPVSGAQGTGGGQSSLYAMPSYQSAATSVNYPGPAPGRMIPDVAALAGWPLYAIANYGLPVTAKQLTSNVATLSTPSTQGLDLGEEITVGGVGAPFDGTFVITGGSAVSVSYALTAPDVLPTPVSPTGTITQACNSYPCSATQFPWTQVYGTSAATPLVAVGIANLNAVLTAIGLPAVDNGGGAMDVHSILYDPRNAAAMTDVTDGSSDIFNLGGWTALPGYDMTTGMGVPNFTTLANILIARLSPTPTPAPTTTTTPTVAPSPVPTSTPTARPTSTPTPSSTPQPLGPASANPEKAVIAAPGIVILSAASAERVTPRTMIEKSAIRVKNAPVVEAKSSAPVSLVARGLRPGISYSIRIKGSETTATLGRTTSDSAGLAQLPVFLLTKPGTYTLEIVDSNTKAVSYVKVVIVRIKR